MTEDNYKDIAKLMLSELSDSLKEKSISFGYSDDVPALLVSKMDGTEEVQEISEMLFDVMLRIKYLII